MGRRKIEIQPLTDDRNRTVTFVKRKAGLFKKAHELAVLCQVDLAVIIVGNNNKVYEFSSVDTGELINAYQNIGVPHEKKGPENYGNYKKKKHLSLKIVNDEESLDEHDSDYDSSLPEPKRQKRLFDKMNSGIYNKRQHRLMASNGSSSLSGAAQATGSREDMMAHQRPVLRVQIPSDAKGGKDSDNTITALETTKKDDKKDSQPNSNLSAGGVPNINTPRFSSFNTFRSPESRKPITQLPLPIHNKSQTSSPLSATAPPLPSGNMGYFGLLPQPSPSIAYPAHNGANFLPTPILNQVFNQHYQNSEDQNHQQGLSQNQQQQQPQPPKFKPPYYNQAFQIKDETTPASALPSRYVNEIFPSPLNFYAPQEWPTGMTPIHTGTSLYFMNMLPSATLRPQINHQQPNQGSLPVQFMGQFNMANPKRDRNE